MKKYIMKILLILIIVYTGCKDDPPVVPPPPEPKAALTLQDASCLEAWIKLELENIEPPVNVTLTKDSIPILQINNLTSNDTIVYIDSLQPNQTYKFHSVIQPTNQSDEVKSNELQVTTLAATSQEFTWQAYSWGMHSSSEIRDIAILDENNIWCVGEIYMNDSSGNPEPNAYNAVLWAGSEWELKRIKTKACGGVDYPPIQTIFVFSSIDILFAHIDGSISHFNGKEFTNDCSLIIQLNGSANKMWGRFSNEFFVVSVNGFIASYQNGQWSKIETGTDINFRDIYGSLNKDNNELEIIALASNSGINQRKKIVRIKDQAVETLPDSGLADYLSTIWFISGRKYCIGGQGYYESNTFGPVWERDNTIPQFHITSIRGAGLNDIVLGGSFGLLMHYNGVNWMNYAYITASYFDVISEVAIKGNTIVAAGFKGSKAVVLIGKR